MTRLAKDGVSAENKEREFVEKHIREACIQCVVARIFRSPVLAVHFNTSFK